MASKIVAGFVVIFMMFQKAKHVFSRSHGNSVGFHANWQVCIYVCVMVFLSFQPDVFPFFHCVFCHFVCFRFLFAFFSLIVYIIIVANVCLCVCIHTRITIRLFLISLCYGKDICKSKNKSLISMDLRRMNKCADSCVIHVLQENKWYEMEISTKEI